MTIIRGSMKKFLVVLTILVLVAGFAFAESQISGKVTAAYTFDFDAETVDYAVSGTNAKLEWTWNSHTVGPYEGNKPYATVTVALTMKTTIAKNAVAGKEGWTAWSFDNSYKATSPEELAFSKITIQLKEAKIVGEDWSIDLLKATIYGEYAKSAWDMAYNDDDDEFNAAYTFDNTFGGKANGVTVTYKDYTVGVAAESVGAGLYNLAVSTQSPVFEFDGGSAQVAATIGAYKLLGSDSGKFAFAFSAKADYKIEKVALDAAFDGAYDAERFEFDADFNATYEPATLNFYYASLLWGDYMPGYEKYMSVKVSVDVAKIAENVPVKAYVALSDILNKNDYRMLFVGAEYDGEKISAEASFGYHFENKAFYVGGTAKAKELVSGFGLEGGANYVKLADELKIAAAEVGVNYTAEKFDASAVVALAKVSGSDLSFGFKATVESDKIVENAKLFATLTVDGKGAVAVYEFLDDLRTSLHLADFEDITAPGYKLKVGCEIAF